MSARIESVRIETSGIAVFTVTGGLSFSVPVSMLDAAFMPLREIMKSLDADAARMGYELNDEEYLRLRDVDETWRTEKKALELCSRAEQSSAGLCAKLLKRGFPLVRAREVITKLKADGIVDDRRFARAWTLATLARKPIGPRVLASELHARLSGGPCTSLCGNSEANAIVRETISSIEFDAILEKAARRELAKMLRRNKKNSAVMDQSVRIAPKNLFRDLRLSLRSQGFSSDSMEAILGSLYQSWVQNDFEM
jgi:SOS response regulatory protein OraA/RecX